MESFTLVGDYSASSWTVTSDGKGGIDIVDPPAHAAATNNYSTTTLPAGNSAQPVNDIQNGFAGSTSTSMKDGAVALSCISGDQTKVFVADTPALGGDHVIVPVANTPVLGGDQVIVPPVNASGLNEHAIAPPVNTSGLGGGHAIVAPINTSVLGAIIAASLVTDAAASFFNSDQGLNSDSDQNGLLTKTFSLGNDHAIDLSGTSGVQTNVSATDTSLFDSDPAVVAAVKTSVLGGDQVIAPPVNASELNEHAIAPPVNTSGLNEHAVVPPVDTPVHGSIIVLPVTEAAGNAASFLSGPNTNSDQNGLLTKTFSPGNEHAIDLSVSGGVQNNLSVTGTSVFSGDHAIIVAAVASVLGGDQVIVPPVNTSGLNEHAVALPVTPTGLGDNTIGSPIITSAHHDAIIAPPVTDAASNAASFLSDANTNSDQGLSLGGDQNGLLTKTSALGNDHIIAPPAVTSGLAGDQVIAPSVNTSWLNEHVIALPIKTSGLNDHAIAPPTELGDGSSPISTSVHGAIVAPPATDAAGNAASFLSDGNTNSDQGLSLGGDQNGLLTKTSALGNDHAIDPSNNMSVLGVEHAINSSNNISVLGVDHAVSSPTNTAVLGSDHVIIPPVTIAAGSDQVTAGELTNDLHGGFSHILSSLLNVLTGSEQGAVQVADNASPIAHVAPVTPVLDSKYLTDSTNVDGSVPANSEVTPSAPPANEHILAPAPVMSTALASTFGALGNDSFAFHPNIGSDTAQNTGGPANELAHNNIQIAGPALGSTAPELHAEFAFDVIHQDVTDVAAAVDQFHQMAASCTLLH